MSRVASPTFTCAASFDILVSEVDMIWVETNSHEKNSMVVAPVATQESLIHYSVFRSRLFKGIL